MEKLSRTQRIAVKKARNCYASRSKTRLALFLCANPVPHFPQSHMPLSSSKRFIFIHIPKCAGTSISTALNTRGARLQLNGMPTRKEKVVFNSGSLAHITAEKLRSTLPEATWRNYFKFTFVRNPWDLSVSLYHFHKSYAIPPSYFEMFPTMLLRCSLKHLYSYFTLRNQAIKFQKNNPYIIKQFTTTGSFKEWILQGIYMPCCSSFITDSKGTVMVDFVGRYETLQEDFSKICRRLNISAQLLHLNRSTHRPYREYYDSESKAIVARHFGADIERFAYRF